MLFKRTRLLVFICVLFSVAGLLGATNQDCEMCHSDPELTTEKRGRTISLYVDFSEFTSSVHGDLECVNCHFDADVEEFPHEEELEDVVCGNCHDDASEDFYNGIHGIALKRGAPYAPTCKECHGVHDILHPVDEKSRTYKMNIPMLCGKCHREGAPVTRVYNIPERDILTNYSQSIHGEGLFKQGLIVTATCNDCHGNHLVLPHTSPRSLISPQNIAQTCMKCHARIEEVHLKVIKGELWEKEPGTIPACTDCHPPHRVDKENLVIRTSDRECLECHEKSDIHKLLDGEKISMVVNKENIQNSVHRNIPCVKCHSDVSPQHKRPCDTAGRVDCSKCHAQVAENYFTSDHGQAYFQKDPNAPYCVDCHGSHETLSHMDERDKTFRANIPDLCGNCHGRLTDTKRSYIDEHGMVYIDYSTSVHGIGLVEKGLLPSAVCTDCHNSHLILESKNEQSSVHYSNLSATCASCHRGIYNEFVNSVHHFTKTETEKKLPNCEDCHSAHQISEHEKDKFITEVTHQCGSCHGKLSETYSETMHGKTYALGYLKAAKCSDCHGAHDTRSVNDPDSQVGFNKIVQTCQKCHPDANRRFTGYLTHATHHDRAKYPILHFTFWAMTSLLIGVFSFFGIHTLLWLPRSFKHLKEKKKHKSSLQRYYFQRFSSGHRIMHVFVIFSFVLLALTGMMLKFSSMPWAKFLSDLFGGVETAGTIHRFAAIITFGYFIAHIISLIQIKIKRKRSWREIIFGPNSMMFNKKDLKDFIATIKWFLGFGSRPQYGKWTYWEKFDYFAVFWGVAIIGFSGLILWFPEFFTKFFPGWFINVATIVHSDEALLAVGFIFTIHFFNTHLRPESFPMDKVIFTGLVPLDEYKADRPEEYKQLKENSQLKKKVVLKEVSTQKSNLIAIFGYTFLTIGITVILLIIYSMLFGYK